MNPRQLNTIGLLLSGGLDSSILLAHLLEQGRSVQPFYIRGDLHWEPCEQVAVRSVLAASASSRLRSLVTLDLPLADLYGDHWSVTGQQVPAAGTPDEAVYLPGRNLLLVVKAAVWCRLHGIGQLALAPLGTNPFSDTSPDFFAALATTLNRATGGELTIERPFAQLDKRQVMQLGGGLPLEMTFSCIDPVDGHHCGRCNKCAERQAAFRLIDAADPTRYAETRER